MIRLIHRTILRRPNSKGQALVEFAFVFPLFMVLLVAVVEYGFLDRPIDARIRGCPSGDVPTCMPVVVHGGE